MRKKLPIGIQTFEKIIEGNYIYVDKTKIAFDLIENGNCFFLSRPRRFGKSLFLSTLKAIFEGKKEFFKNLYIYDKWDWSKKYPIFHIDFGNQKAKTEDDLISFISNQIDDVANFYKISLSRKVYYEKFRELLEKLSQKYEKAVVLIDEYDKPILDNITKSKLATEMREILRGFYTVLKGADPFLKFVFLTGVSKFSKVSIFSGLNNLEDITMASQFACICGYTQKDVETSFKDWLDGVDLEKLKKWYDGYSWLGESVYNPFDILLFLRNKKYKSYWFETGTPTFLIYMINQKRYFVPELENLEIEEDILSRFDVNDIQIEALFFQTGYLTIKKTREQGNVIKYTLSYPNLEVRLAFSNSLIDFFTKEPSKKYRHKDALYDAILDKDMEGLNESFFSLFAGISYTNFTKNDIHTYEGYYASLIYSYLSSLGFTLVPEDVTNLGRIDLTLKTDEAIFIFEFKVDEQGGLEQIKEKRYYEKYLAEKKEIFLIAIEFSKEKRNIVNYSWEKLLKQYKESEPK